MQTKTTKNHMIGGNIVFIQTLKVNTDEAFYDYEPPLKKGTMATPKPESLKGLFFLFSFFFF